MIRAEDYTKAYRTTVAVDGLSFHVEPGQILGLLGRNGAGKTTTLRAIAGIIPPTRGSLSVAGHDLKTEEIAAKSQLAYIPDDPKLFEALSVWEHLEFTAMAYRVDNPQAPGEALLTRFELMEKKDSLVQELSRGMRQKVAICCAYLHEPRAILFDEPLTGLDPRGIRTLKETIRERARDGAAVIVSSHLLSLVEDLCTHLLILDRGQSRFFGHISNAQRAFAGLADQASLEDIFFHATEGGGVSSQPSSASRVSGESDVGDMTLFDAEDSAAESARSEPGST
ncbi:MAG: ABC transporter ATP-binding protein [Planctomycetaceae bacterium]|nr:MAG: ABC transporter ATP-binding protein [Planctomycetaceae bacterium]